MSFKVLCYVPQDRANIQITYYVIFFYQKYPPFEKNLDKRFETLCFSKSTIQQDVALNKQKKHGF